MRLSCRHPLFQVDAYQVIQQQRLRTEQVTQEAIEQQQRQQQTFSTINEKTEKFMKYSPFLKERSTPAAENQNLNIEITVTSPEDKLSLDTDESYTLVVQVITPSDLRLQCFTEHLQVQYLILNEHAHIFKHFINDNNFRRRDRTPLRPS